uniref:Chromogranin-A n=1 Tax=Salvator merianae TaxID=96440 RepID=A0A8D0C800_SALMN
PRSGVLLGLLLVLLDGSVMNCIVEVISDIVSKPNPLPVSQECLEILQRDERILSILRHQNLLKELQEIAIQGATERTEQQKKNSGFEDELSEVLESQSNKNTEGGQCQHNPLKIQHPSLDETRQEEEASHGRDTESEEVEEEPSRDVEDAKRWNKMDELAKQLTATKRAEEVESDEDPDRSMKLALRSHKYDFHNPEEEEGRPQRHHSKEERNDGTFPIVAMPEEKKDEEGSAHRRTEDQELESLAAIEAELEKVAHKLHALRRG